MVAEITMSAQVQFSAFDLPPTLGRTASPEGIAIFARASTRAPPSRSAALAAVTRTTTSSPRVSTTM